MPGFHPSGPAAVRPADYRAYRVDLPAVRGLLAGSGSKRLSIPDPAGTATEFTVVEDSVMAPSMQAAHPDIRTYRGSAANGTTIRLDVTPLGFHAMVRRPDGVVWYVEPATRAAGESRVLSFAGSAAGEPGSTFVEQEVRRTTDKVAAEAGDSDFSTPGGIVSQRTYRLALVTDPSYAAFVAPGATTHAASDPLVLAAKTTLINRVNEAYNDDVAYKFTLIAGTDSKLNLLTTAEFSGANGPCGANACYPGATGSYDCGSVLERNTFALGMLVGADSFDLGHIGVGVDGGGVAGLGVVGTARQGDRLHRRPDACRRRLRDRLRRARDGPPDGWRPHLQRHHRLLLRRQPQRSHLGGAGFGRHDHGLRRHLLRATTCSRTATPTSPSTASRSSRPPPPPHPATRRSGRSSR